jgi:sigma-B regulation protein RsbU (phosphoserine phosphatase)
MAIPAETAALFRQLLLGDAARLVVAIVSMAIGLASIFVQGLRWKSPDRVRLWFGLLALLYGYRALLMTETARLFESADAIDFQIALVTFTIGIPAILFGWGLVSKQQNRVTKSILAVNVAMALAYLLFHSNGEAVRVLFIVNNLLVITFTIAIIVYLYTRSAAGVPELKTLRIVLVIWGGFVLYNNLRGLLPLPHSADYEFVGFAIFLCSLAYLVARRSMQTEEALASIRSELEIARRIQKSILPEQMPQVPGLRIAAQYLPMSQVAGDFYDFLHVGEKRLGLLIADVSGHGVPAALVASMVKVAIAAQAEHADDPAKVMAGLNSVLSGKLQGQFVTAAYLFFDLEKGTACYSAAGHPPMLHYHAAEATVGDVVENGLILGIMPFASYESRSVSFNPGDRFLLYTDGVVEAARDEEEFGRSRLERVLASTAGGAEAICNSVSSEVSAWSRGVAGDDITVVAVELA